MGFENGIEDITRRREDMNFTDFTNERDEKIKFISSSHRVIFFLLYRQIYLSPFFTECFHKQP